MSAAVQQSLENGSDVRDNYETLKNELPSSAEALNSAYERAGNHQTARSLGNTAGYIGAGTVLTAAGVPAPLVYGTLGGANAYAKTDDIGDIAFETGKSAAFGFLSSTINSATGKLLSKTIPVMNPVVSATNTGVISRATQLSANIFRNFLSGSVGGYGANAITGEARNLYDYARGREVTKEDWLKPIWSKDALRTTIISGGFSAIFGTSSDIKKANAQLDKNINTLNSVLQKYNKDIQNALRKGDAQTAYSINENALSVINNFNSMQYIGKNISDASKEALLNYWNNIQNANINTYYYPNMLNGDIPQSSDSVSMNPKTLPPQTNQTDNITTVPPIQATSQQAPSSQNSTQNTTQKSQNSIQGLEDFTEDDIKDMITDHIENVTEGNVKIKGIALNGSRVRGDAKADSDLDVVVEYDSDLSEDTMFNALNEEPLVIEGITVDINPIKKGKSGTLDEYMKRSQAYDEEKKATLKEDTPNYTDKGNQEQDTYRSYIERYYKPDENKSYYELTMEGNYEDNEIALEQYLKDKYDLKSKGIRVSVGHSKQSESEYITLINDETDEDITTIRLSTHSNNEPSVTADVRIYYDKNNDTIDDIQRLIDKEVTKVLDNYESDSSDILKEDTVPYEANSQDDLFKAIMEQLDQKEIAAEEAKLVQEQYGDEATDMDWSDYVDDDIQNKAEEIVYNRFVESEKGKEFIRKFNDTNKQKEEIISVEEAIKEFSNATKKVSRNIVETIANSLNLPISHDGKKVQSNMKEKAGNNLFPKITEITKLFEGVTDKNAIDFRELAKKESLKLFRDTDVLIKDTRSIAEINKSGIGKTFSGTVTESKIQSADNIKDIIEEGIYLYSTQSEDDKKKGMMFHHFFSPVLFNGKNGLMKVVIIEYTNNPSMKDKYYYHQLEYLDINEEGSDSTLPRKNRK